MSRYYCAHKPLTLNQIQRLLALDGEAVVRVWTHQDPAALAAAEATGWLTGPRERAGWGVAGEEMAEHFRPAYDWMRVQMAARLPNFSGDYPVWAWPKRPSCRGPLPTSWGRTVLVAADVPRQRILASDFDLWHFILDGHPIAASEAEWDAYWAAEDARTADSNAQDNPAPGRRERPHAHPTWERALTFGARGLEEARWNGGGPRRTIQLCVDGIRLDEIVWTRERRTVPEGFGRRRPRARAPKPGSSSPHV